MWGWDELSEWKAKKQSEDPADMELFMLTVIGQGAFAFEFDDAFLIAEAFSEHQNVSEQVADNGGDGVDEQPLQTVEAPVTEGREGGSGGSANPQHLQGLAAKKRFEVELVASI
jgi:hypothetical protein